MNKTIFKYPITHPENIVIEMPKEAKILTAQCQNGIPCIWALVNDIPNREREKRYFEVFGTGHDIPQEGLESNGSGRMIPIERKYVNTFQMNTGLVFHLFERF